MPGSRFCLLPGTACLRRYLGTPDFRLLTQTELVNAVQHICQALIVPVPWYGLNPRGRGKASWVVSLQEQLNKIPAAIETKKISRFLTRLRVLVLALVIL
jgi:hypothetical protein